MPARTLPNLGLQAFFDVGESGWADEVSLNFLLLSVLVQGGVLETVSTTPSSPTNGQVYLFSASHPTQANKIGIRDADAWINVTPLEGWRVYDRAANALLLFDGTAWVPFTAGGSPYSTVAEVTGTAANLLASQAGQYLRFTATSAKSLTVRPNSTEALPDNGEWNLRNVGAANLTLIAGAGVTINPPAGGSLVMAPGMSAMLKRAAVNVFDLIGHTNP
jgi:hypothetical protein